MKEGVILDFTKTEKVLFISIGIAIFTAFICYFLAASFYVNLFFIMLILVLWVTLLIYETVINETL